MTNLNDALSIVETENQMVMGGEATSAEYEIVVKNQHNGAKTRCWVYPENTIKQVFDNSIDDIGLESNPEEIYYVNERTRKSTSDSNMRIEDFELMSGDTLAIITEGKVAAQ